MKRSSDSLRCDVGIITWHYYTNVGSNLQAYALYKIIEDMGYSCEFINYRHNTSQSGLRKLSKDITGTIDAMLPGTIPSRIRVQSYYFQSHFIKQSPLLAKDELTECNSWYKILLCGSDQIWAPNVLDTAYLLDFASDSIPRCSYASSIGLPQIPAELQQLYRKNLQRFNKITVREKQGAALLKSMLQKEIDWVLDPTFLVEQTEWKKIERLYQIPKSRYLFCYLLGNNSEHRAWIDELAKNSGLKVLCMSDQPEDKREGWMHMRHVGPREFLGYIDKSEFVVTDSFHGMALSINMNKDFYVLERFKSDDVICQNSRIYNIIESFGLESRVMKTAKTMCESVNWETVNNRLQRERTRSRALLNEMLTQNVQRIS